MTREESVGFFASYPPAAQGIRDGAKGSGGGGPGDRVLHFTTVDWEEGASGARADRHLREDGDVSATSRREVSNPGRPRPHRRFEEKARRPARALVQGSARVDSPQVLARKNATDACDVREGALWRPRAARHPKAAGRREASDETGI